MSPGARGPSAGVEAMAFPGEYFQARLPLTGFSAYTKLSVEPAMTSPSAAETTGEPRKQFCAGKLHATVPSAVESAETLWFVQAAM